MHINITVFIAQVSMKDVSFDFTVQPGVMSYKRNQTPTNEHYMDTHVSILPDLKVYAGFMFCLRVKLKPQMC